MEKKSFKNLLEDLYLIYNSDKISDIDRLVEGYNGKEFDAIKTIYIRYNFKQSPFYNPNIGTDKHVKSLIDSYSNGQRVLSKDYVLAEQEKKEISIKIEEEKKKQEEEESRKSFIEQQEKILNEKLSKANDELLKQIEHSTKQLELIKKDLSQVVEKDMPFDIQVKFNFDSKNIIIPELSNFLYVSTNQRIILKDSEGNIVGAEVESILDDYFSDPSKPIREVILNKV